MRLFYPDSIVLDRERLPRKPFCSDDPKKYGIRIRAFNIAKRYPFMQPNAPGISFRMVFDVDKPRQPEPFFLGTGRATSPKLDCPESPERPLSSELRDQMSGFLERWVSPPDDKLGDISEIRASLFMNKFFMTGPLFVEYLPA